MAEPLLRVAHRSEQCIKIPDKIPDIIVNIPYKVTFSCIRFGVNYITIAQGQSKSVFYMAILKMGGGIPNKKL